MSVIENREIDWIDKPYKGVYFMAARMSSFERAVEPWNGISPQNILDTCSTMLTCWSREKKSVAKCRDASE